MDWLTIVQNVGVPAAVMAAGGMALWRIVVWAGNEVVIPLRDRHVKFLDSLQANLETQAATTSQIVATQQELACGIREVKQAIEGKDAHIVAALGKQTDAIVTSQTKMQDKLTELPAAIALACKFTVSRVTPCPPNHMTEVDR